MKIITTKKGGVCSWTTYPAPFLFIVNESVRLLEISTYASTIF